jgi:pre-rRNA-processing protein TSR3
VKLFILRLHQDDPRKCTAARLLRWGNATRIFDSHGIHKNTLVLNPLVDEVFSPGDQRYLSHGLVVIDCSWKRVDRVFRQGFKGIHRRLPLLLPVNPINYGRISMLSSAEALAATLYIAGFKEQAKALLKRFKWGQNFLLLNGNALTEYSDAQDQDQILEIECAYYSR